MQLSLVTDFTPLTLETNEGEVNLKITKFTVSDAERREKLMTSTWEDDTLPDYVKLNRFNVARLMCSVKDSSGQYYFTGSIDEVKSLLPKELADVLCQEVDKLNPIHVPDFEKGETAMAAKKKKS